MAVDVMIVGAPRCGTSTLLAYLGEHPAIQPQVQREMTWFGDAELAARPFPESLYFGDAPRDGRLRLGKLAGLMYLDDAIGRLRAHNPRVQAIAILRDPVARAYSAFWFARWRGREPLREFEDAVFASSNRAELERFHYLEGGLYTTYLDRVYGTLGREALHVVIFEQFLADPRGSLDPVLARLGLDADVLPPDAPRENESRAVRSVRLSKARYGWTARVGRRVLSAAARERLRQVYRRTNAHDLRAGPMDSATKQRLREYYEEPNRQLEELLGRQIDAW